MMKKTIPGTRDAFECVLHLLTLHATLLRLTPCALASLRPWDPNIPVFETEPPNQPLQSLREFAQGYVQDVMIEVIQ